MTGFLEKIGWRFSGELEESTMNPRWSITRMRHPTTSVTEIEESSADRIEHCHGDARPLRLRHADLPTRTDVTTP